MDSRPRRNPRGLEQHVNTADRRFPAGPEGNSSGAESRARRAERLELALAPFGSGPELAGVELEDDLIRIAGRGKRVASRAAWCSVALWRSLGPAPHAWLSSNVVIASNSIVSPLLVIRLRSTFR